jgi:hypothetical protein
VLSLTCGVIGLWLLLADGSAPSGARLPAASVLAASAVVLGVIGCLAGRAGDRSVPAALIGVALGSFALVDLVLVFVVTSLG